MRNNILENVPLESPQPKEPRPSGRARVLKIAILLAIPAFAAPPDWTAATAKLTPGMRVEVQHQGKLEHGIFALANGSEIVITTSASGFLSIPQADVERLVRRGAESPNLSFFRNAGDQLFPKSEVVYERAGKAQAQPKSRRTRKQ